MPCAGQRMAGFGGSNFSAVGEAAMYASATANDSYTPMRGAERYELGTLMVESETSPACAYTPDPLPPTPP